MENMGMKVVINHTQYGRFTLRNVTEIQSEKGFEQ